MKKKIAITMIFLSIIEISKAQYTHRFEYSTPQAVAPSIGALMKQVDYPVNFYTGLVNIEIPLYEIVEGDIKVPISLQYHASGIKVLDFEGQVGAGWSLSSDFSIFRKVEGLSDDGAYKYFDKFSGDRYSWLNLLNGQVDSSPDIYYYKLLDKSGKFYFSKGTFEEWQGRIVTNPYEPIRIEVSKSGFINAFRIVNDNGMKYDFSERLGDLWYLNKITSANEKHIVTFTYNKDPLDHELVQYIDYIGIDEMVRRNYVQTLFAHQGENYSYPYITLFKKGTYSILSHQNPREIDNNPTLKKAPNEVSFPVSPGGPVTTHSTVKCLQKIESHYVKVDFIGTTNISSIIVTDKQSGQTIRNIYFHYNKNKLTTLEKVEIVGSDGQKEVYLMTYNEMRPYNTDKKNNNGMDHWGYYNGWDNPMGGNTTLIPVDMLKTREYLPGAWANPITGMVVPATEEWEYDPVKILIKNLPYRKSERGSAPNAMQHTMLTSITYPTGRKSCFFYEAHQYLHKYSEEKKYNFGYGNDESSHDDYEDGEIIYPDEVRYAGGLRIKKIDEYDPVSKTTLTKEYKYGKQENGVGYIKHQIDLEDYGYEVYKIGVTYGKTGNSSVKEPYITKMRMYTKFAVPSLFFGNGSSTVYDYVTEYTVNNTTGEKLKSVYHYNAENHSPAYRVGYTQLIFDPLKDWKHGQLLDKIDYKYSNNLYKKALHKKNEYLEYQHDATLNMKIWRNILVNSDYESPHPYEDVSNYELDYPLTRTEFGDIVSGRMLLAKETATTYTDVGDSIGSVTRYTYTTNHSNWPFHAKGPLLIKTESMADDNKWSVEKYSYPLNTSFAQSEESARLKLIENNQINTVLRKEILKGNAHTIQNNKYLISIDNNLPLPAIIATNTGINNSEEERVKIIRYDAYGNPVHIQRNGNNAVYLWAYYGQYLVAEIQAATYKEVDQALSNVGLSSIKAVSENPNPDKSKLDKLRGVQSLKQTSIVTYEHKPLVGIISITNPQGITVYYEYDAFGRLNTMKDIDGNILNRYFYKYANQ